MRRRSGSCTGRGQLEDAKYSIHFHVWTQAEFLRLILDCRERFERAFDLEAAAGRRSSSWSSCASEAAPDPPPPASRAGPSAAAAARAPNRRSSPRSPSCERWRSRVRRVLSAARRGRAPVEAHGHRSPSTPRALDAPLAIEARDLEKTFRIPTHRVDSLKERIVRPFASRDVPRAAGARRRLLRRPPGRVLRHRRPQRLRQEHAAEAAGEHLPRRRRARSAWPAASPRSSSSASASTPS